MAPRINFKHKREVPFEERVRESQRVRERHAERVPVIVEKAPSSDIAAIDKCAQTPYLPISSHAPGVIAQTPRRARPSRAPHSPHHRVPARRRCKYLIPMDMTVGQLVYVLRKRISLPSDKAVFVFVGNTLPPSSALMSNIYLKHKDEDGFLYICYSGENAFGAM